MKFAHLATVISTGSILFLSVCNGAYASSLEDYLETESDSINACMVDAIYTDDEQLSEQLVSTETLSLTEVRTCLGSAMTHVTDEVDINLEIENLSADDGYILDANFSFAPAATEDGTVSVEELNEFQSLFSSDKSGYGFEGSGNNFDLYARSCSLADIDDFSFFLSDESVDVITSWALLTLARHIATTRTTSSEASDRLTHALDSLNAQFSDIDVSPLRFNVSCQTKSVAVASLL